MPLFQCARCGCVDNTALGDFWVPWGHDEPVLCTECSEGAWHGRFEKMSLAEFEARHGVGEVEYVVVDGKVVERPRAQKARK